MAKKVKSKKQKKKLKEFPKYKGNIPGVEKLS
jgi:hypothetical protein